jgi:NAD(P)-dependent dehydrogenase (short-subunit alcohol dehydrogenase family)
MDMDLSNKTFVVTGATSGIGLATAEALAQAGARVIGAGRSAERCAQSEQHLRRLAGHDRIDYLAADLSQQSEVVRLAGQIQTVLSERGIYALDGLVNNAGIFTYWLTLTVDGIEMQWAVNHLAAFRLTRQLLPLLQAAPTARIVTVSSDSHYGARIDWDDPQLRRHYNGLEAYGTTKLANILFTQELNRRLGMDSKIRAFAADPGLVKTDIGMKGTPSVAGWVWKIRRSGGTPPEIPAQGILYLLSEPSLQDSREIYWKDRRPKRASHAALDSQTAVKLWSLSEKYCSDTPAHSPARLEEIEVEYAAN